MFQSFPFNPFLEFQRGFVGHSITMELVDQKIAQTNMCA